MRIHRCEIVGSVNGLICICRGFDFYYPSLYYICNPITQDHITIPNSHNEWISRFWSGFGFDSISNEYKVVRVLIAFSKCRAEVYTLGSRTWREIPMEISCVSSMKESNVFLNGVIYWVACRYDTTLAIMSFNVATEEFDIIELPSKIQKVKLDVLDLAVLRDCLCLIEGCYMWVRKDHGVQGSWIKERDIKWNNAIHFQIGRNEIINVRNYELVILNSKNIAYQNNRIKRVRPLVVNGNSSSLVLVGIGSLISPKVLGE
ncbi:hypothetical protein AQUCO_06100006v1 [Aquilegia coerulea]|uniref:F-box associated beta-propeller type 3 domain-containing protein n=1 Tax=Aquilegia coerulea TaxID=218851 RepID=A0A2G5CD51_AQUCA|nr:hypothetical protein AQUCO_06100006v1 [Aquilegia coerulea]